MDTTDKDTIAVLNELIATCKDGVNGFRSAANGVDSVAAKSLFTSRATSIEQSASDLQAVVRRLGGDPTDSGHLAESLHRGWVNMEAALDGNDEHDIIEEALRGEKIAVEHYREALPKIGPDAIHALVEHQLRGAQQNLAAVQALLSGPASPPSSRSAASFDVRP